MEARWERHYVPFERRGRSVLATARVLLDVLVEQAPDKVTAMQLRGVTGFSEFKVRSYLGLLEFEGLVEAVAGAGTEPNCRRFRVCRCIGWGVTRRGRKFLCQAEST